MYFKTKIIKGKKYKYAVKTMRLPNGKVVTLNKIYNNESEKELNNLFEKKEKIEHIKYIFSKIKPDYIFTKEQIEKIELMKFDYKTILKKLSKSNIKDLLDR